VSIGEAERDGQIDRIRDEPKRLLRRSNCDEKNANREIKAYSQAIKNVFFTRINLYASPFDTM
jgi:DNA-binding transcriptional regulator WhiA